MTPHSRRRPHWMMAVLLLSSPSTSPVTGFGIRQAVPTTRPTWQVQYFRSDSSELYRTAMPRTPLPAWLAIPKSHLSEANLLELEQAMQTTLYTPTEVTKLLFAIEEASQGDRNLVAGAAEFCRILVETMELGLPALIAAAFHYTACVQSRQQGLAAIHIPANVANFGAQAVSIARDAARLKQLENLAAKVMQNDSGRVRPDAKDADNLRKLLLSETRDWRGLAIRSAAALYRLRGLSGPTREGTRTAREALLIYAPLASRLGMHRLKNELESAAFRILYPRQYSRVIPEDDADISNSMKLVLDEVKEEMTDMLANDPEFSSLVETFSVTARVKEPYSMWQKMLRNKHSHFLQVPDAMALRVILDAKKKSDDEPAEVTRARERALCYYAQRLCTQRWKPVEGNPRFKDYVERPKQNGYQSLHYTAQTRSQGKDWSLEIQVRSGEMHQVAEFGLASHWDYKAQKKAKSSSSEEVDRSRIDHSSDAYLRKVQEWHWQQHAGALTAPEASVEPIDTSDDASQSKIRTERIRARTARLQPYIQALTEAQSDLARDFVFVFLSQSQDEKPSEGKVLALPSGACVLDALREGERTMGRSLSDKELVLNGISTSVTRQLHNGDVLTLPLSAAPAVSL